jgi:hypothetical protein
LEAEIIWLDSQVLSMRSLILRHLLPQARQGLAQLKMAGDTADRMLSIVEARVSSGQNGAVWQRRLIQRHRPDMALLVREYRSRQTAGFPVHSWDL